MMNVLRNHKVWALALAAGVMTASASAQQSAPAAPAAPQPPATTPAPATPPAQTPLPPYVVGQAVPEVQTGTTMMSLTLDQAMEMALEKNLALKAARLNPQGVDYQLQSARAAFDPQITGTYGYRNVASLSTDTLDKVSQYKNKTQTYNAGVSKIMPWYGGRLTANFNNNRGVNTNPRTPVNPALNVNLSVNYTQPILAGFKIDQTRNQLRTLALQRQVSDIQLLSTIENTKANVRTAYWNLRQAIEQIEIQRRSLALAQRLYRDNQTKVEIGTLAPIETTTSETQVANAEQALLNAQIQWQNAALTLKSLLANGPADPIYKSTIDPTERPELTIQSVDIPAAVQKALAERTDLTQARRNIDISDLNLAVTKDALKPQLDLQGGYSTTGRNDQLANGVTGYGTALSQALQANVPTWNMQFNFTYPLGMAAAKANFARAQLQIEQSSEQLKAQELSVSTQVTSAGLAVENTYKQYQAAQTARQVAERNAEAEQTRFDVGMSTNYNVVQAQNNLTTQRLAELRALISYLNAVSEFDRVQRVGP